MRFSLFAGTINSKFAVGTLNNKLIGQLLRAELIDIFGTTILIVDAIDDIND
jgi:hypothetical protein